MQKYALLIIMMFFFQRNMQAQIDKNSPLFTELKTQDSLFFERGFNNCDMAYMEKSVDDNLRFYHDKGGFQDRKLFLQRVKQNICSNPDQKPIRKRIENSMEVFPLYDNGKLYGAVQSGEHQFYIREKNKEDVLGGQAKFTTVWIKKDGRWIISDILSYDHREPGKSEITDDLQQLLKDNHIPTLGLGIIENGKLTQVRVMGTLDGRTATSLNSIFNVASLTKPVTAMIALRLVSLGKWNLDEPLDHYWIDPDIAHDPWHKKLTTRLVLSHQTGFPNWRWQNKDHKLSFEYEPGARYQYSGEGFEYLRKALENKFHKNLEKLAEELIFRPLEMHHTGYIWNEGIDSGKIVVGYDKNLNPYETVKNKTPNAADDLMTSVEDYGRFLMAVMNNELLSTNVFEEMKARQVKTKQDKYFGLGFELYDLGNNEIALSHGGSDKGVNTIVFILPKTRQGLIIFTNVDHGYTIYEALVKYYLGESGKKIIEIETR
ncbi:MULTISPECIES: serine hydrolase [Chryseobacterium]|uniref:CubicO group peptidase (Beta-lactamase class C family) n=1 Tax=Chryseobacterium camelliae TaxID=1265445 RepID=A0ABU0TDE4_9FLAO|nr:MULTISPECIES: serine hydrolase [Chryseobacterium]MDT3407197.1 CubicO group peptidase (beta-lactamase class C family) [Pseudacidovorax intermedius]MDQ1095012.1 CubicO group peptidase (beta-lactamase class C family) [Chryseobacterium camelliae]MDQ1098952.1 CubicO group peptidase (beta-lactamase class C family) [Chryseobacterium sp. SORGH_AS_1048]MDR6086300.1 CubicO group peptidase (beta-lactamase class C family) [Chryseobacterium sp. SORGH_AS_0909]MDR6130672.1 CubicO group peptidase (beta-lac